MFACRWPTIWSILDGSSSQRFIGERGACDGFLLAQNNSVGQRLPRGRDALESRARGPDERLHFAGGFVFGGLHFGRRCRWKSQVPIGGQNCPADRATWRSAIPGPAGCTGTVVAN